MSRPEAADAWRSYQLGEPACLMDLNARGQSFRWKIRWRGWPRGRVALVMPKPRLRRKGVAVIRESHGIDRTS